MITLAVGPPITEPQQPPLALGLTHLAEEVSILVELFRKTEPGENEPRETYHRPRHPARLPNSRCPTQVCGGDPGNRFLDGRMECRWRL